MKEEHASINKVLFFWISYQSAEKESPKNAARK